MKKIQLAFDLKTIMGGLFVFSAFVQAKPEVLTKMHVPQSVIDWIWIITEFSVWLSAAGYVVTGRPKNGNRSVK